MRLRADLDRHRPATLCGRSHRRGPGAQPYALDSTTIDLCWRCSRGPSSASTRAPSRCTPCWICMATSPRLSALQTAKCMTSRSRRDLAGGRGVLRHGPRLRRFERLYRFTLGSAFFVVRTKSNVLLQRRYSHPVDKTTGVRSDHTVILTAIDSAKAYPDALRRVSYLDVETRKRFRFLTNNFACRHLLSPRSTSAAGRSTLLQVDQAAPADQGLLRHQRERGEDANLDCSLGLRAVAIVRKRLGWRRASTRFYRS